MNDYSLEDRSKTGKTPLDYRRELRLVQDAWEHIFQVYEFMVKIIHHVQRQLFLVIFSFIMKCNFTNWVPCRHPVMSSFSPLVFHKMLLPSHDSDPNPKFVASGHHEILTV